MPSVLEFVQQNPENENVFQFALEGLIRLIRYDKEEVRQLIVSVKPKK